MKYWKSYMRTIWLHRQKNNNSNYIIVIKRIGWSDVRIIVVRNKGDKLSGWQCIRKIIETVFGSTNWLTPAVIIVVFYAAVSLAYQSRLPQYIRICLIVSTGLISLLLLSLCYPRLNHPNFLPTVENVQWLLGGITVLAILMHLFCYRRIDNLLDLVMKNTKPGGNKISAWKEIQSIKASNLTLW